MRINKIEHQKKIRWVLAKHSGEEKILKQECSGVFLLGGKSVVSDVIHSYNALMFVVIGPIH